jgi:nucleotide-binding universal stress UspA family protein
MKTLELTTPVAVKNVLFATDFSESSNHALPYALGLASYYKAKLSVVHVIDPTSYQFFASAESWPAMLECAQEFEKQNTKELKAQLTGVPHQLLSPTGDITDVILRLIHDHQIDLLVLGTHGRHGLKKIFLGSIAEEIFRSSPIPVITVGPTVPERTNLVRWNRLVFATDLSDESLAAFPHALSLAQEHRALLTILHVLAKPNAGTTVDCEPDTSFVFRRMKELVPAESLLYLAPHYAVEFGDVPEQIVQYSAENGTDLIILGIRAPQRSLGSVTHFANTTAQQIIANASCPVLTVCG